MVVDDKENLLWFYLDFRNCPSQDSEISDFTYNEIMNQWKNKYEENLLEILKKTGFNVSKKNKKDYFSKLFSFLDYLKFSTIICRISFIVCSLCSVI